MQFPMYAIAQNKAATSAGARAGASYTLFAGSGAQNIGYFFAVSSFAGT